jgi:GGDEF domain-containing protein
LHLDFFKDTIGLSDLHIKEERKTGKMKNGLSTHGLLVYPALLSIWLTVSCAALFYADTNTAMAGTLILAAVAVAALSLISGILVSSVIILTIIVYAVMIFFLYGLQPSSFLIFITFAAGSLGTTFLAWNTSKQFIAVNKQVERDRLMIEEMRIKDQKTGLMRFHYARKTLSTEISRSLRFGKKLSLLLIRVTNWDELAEKIGLGNRDNLLVGICEILFNNSRNIDTLFINMDKIGVILPETNPEGAEVFSRRLIEQVQKRIKQDLKIGIVNFPDDSITDDDLLTKCEHALKISMESNREIVFYSDISGLLKDKEMNFSTDPFVETIHALNYGAEEKSSEVMQLEEKIVYFQGAKSLKDIDFLQKALGKLEEIKNIRLVDFEDEKVTFAIKSDNKNVAELFLNKLEIPNITIEEKINAIYVKLSE